MGESPTNDREYDSNPDFDNLPPLIPKANDGEEPEELRERILDDWARRWAAETSKPSLFDDGPPASACLNVDLRDDNRDGESIDLGELFDRVAAHLSEGDDVAGRVSLWGCRIRSANVNGQVRPHIDLRTSRLGRANFGEASFGGASSFYHASFCDDVSFYRTRFGAAVLFDNVSFGGPVSFYGASFGGTVSFEGASFGGAALFHGASFGGAVLFDSVSFGGDTWFHRASFGGHTDFDRASFSGAARFYGASFGGSVTAARTSVAGGWFGRMPATVYMGSTDWSAASVDLEFRLEEDQTVHRLVRRVRWFKTLFDWRRVRAIGELKALTRASYSALVVVPVFAGLWSEPLEDIFGIEHLPEVMPVTWLLAYLAALSVAAGQLVYQVAAPGLVRENTPDDLVDRARELTRNDDGEIHDERLRLAWEYLKNAAKALPHVRNAWLVRREGRTIWLPHELKFYEADFEPTEADALKKLREEKAERLRRQAESTEDDAEKQRLEKEAEEAAKPPVLTQEVHPLDRRRIVVEEGELARYDQAAAEKRFWAWIAGTLYAVGGWLIVCILLIQVGVVADASDVWPLAWLDQAARAVWWVGMIVLFVFGCLGLVTLIPGLERWCEARDKRRFQAEIDRKLAEAGIKRERPQPLE